jgi:hypothetical protein
LQFVWQVKRCGLRALCHAREADMVQKFLLLFFAGHS